MSFTDQKQRIATEPDCQAPWSSVKNGKRFRCYFCGHKFKVGDKWRWVYTNDIRGSGGNPLVCEHCDGDNADVRRRWMAMCREARTRFWWFNK